MEHRECDIDNSSKSATLSVLALQKRIYQQEFHPFHFKNHNCRHIQQNPHMNAKELALN
jgi:hypothetical protein